MPHADSSLVPPDVTTKAAFYDHVYEQLEALLEGSRYWVSNLAQTSALLYHAYLSSPLFGLHPTDSHSPIINWVVPAYVPGFYLLPNTSAPSSSRLLLGPYQGRPACAYIDPIPGKGVCADAFCSGKSLIVPSVNDYPGHIDEINSTACDGETESEIVIPLRIRDGRGAEKVIGILDLDSISLSTFDSEDQRGLERIAQLLERSCGWPI